MTPAVIASLVVGLALIVVAFLVVGYLDRQSNLRARNTPWAQLGGGVGSIIESVGGFVNMGNANTGS